MRSYRSRNPLLVLAASALFAAGLLVVGGQGGAYGAGTDTVTDTGHTLYTIEPTPPEPTVARPVPEDDGVDRDLTEADADSGSDAAAVADEPGLPGDAQVLAAELEAPDGASVVAPVPVVPGYTG